MPMRRKDYDQVIKWLNQWVEEADHWVKDLEQTPPTKKRYAFYSEAVALRAALDKSRQILKGQYLQVDVLIENFSASTLGAP